MPQGASIDALDVMSLRRHAAPVVAAAPDADLEPASDEIAPDPAAP
jgi:hypothetical protein